MGIGLRQNGFRPKNRNPRVSPDLVEYLRDTYPHRCIRTGESEIEAHRYAAQVELAEKLIAFATRGEDSPEIYVQED